MAQLKQVFGVSKDPILSYVQREHVDEALQDAISGTRQIVIYGSSKQGKSALLDQHIPHQDRVTVHCGPASSIGDIYRALLRQQDVEVVTETQTKADTGVKLGAIAKFKAKLPWIGGAELGPSGEILRARSDTETRSTIEFNLEAAQDVAELLLKLPRKFCVLENFHYLSPEVQSQLAFDIRTFEEMGIRFIILGVWREGNRLAQYCGDLQDRVAEVPVEPWVEDDFFKVIHAGEVHLNVRFSEDISRGIISKAHGSIGVAQELLQKTCAQHGINQRPKELFEVDRVECLEAAVSSKIAEYSARHIRSLESIAVGQRTMTATEGKAALFLPYYFILVIINSDYNELKDGIERAALLSKIKAIHPLSENVRNSDITAMLQRLGALQEKANISPPLFDYDRGTRRVKVIDSTLYFFVDNCDPKDVESELPRPNEGDA
ncbi:hypothetical protein [Fuscovulum blasticum]|uniref:hypothetical protein n=1 Tax=Fuscovulum blasticum TaxID=1075 RepID=UPI000F51720A|nr:hypothetical protein [Fuscovulum blasticum]